MNPLSLNAVTISSAVAFFSGSDFAVRNFAKSITGMRKPSAPWTESVRVQEMIWYRETYCRDRRQPIARTSTAQATQGLPAESTATKRR